MPIDLLRLTIHGPGRPRHSGTPLLDTDFVSAGMPDNVESSMCPSIFKPPAIPASPARITSPTITHRLSRVAVNRVVGSDMDYDGNATVDESRTGSSLWKLRFHRSCPLDGPHAVYGPFHP